MLVSIVVPTYNRENYIIETLNSIKQQTFRPLELIIVDNCSSDSTCCLCKTFADSEIEKDFSIRVLQESKRGASFCRNTGAKAAHGQWLYFFDSDDLMSADFIYNAMQTVSDETQIVAAATNIVDGATKRRRVFNYSAKVEEQILTGELSTQSMVLRSDFFRKIGYWNEKLPRWNDWELGVRVLLAGPVVSWLRDKAYHEIRAHENSITGNSFSTSAQALLDACRTVEDDLKNESDNTGKGLRALAYRVYILGGIFKREKSLSHSNEARKYADTIACRKTDKFFGYILMNYVAHGGKGAWLIARTIL